ncbi:MAG: S-adenosylmethionine:tRNA ribosyltransferase-isomerase, partial [Desulfuromonadales bacterium]
IFLQPRKFPTLMLETLQNIRIEDFDYPLPADQIAQFPLEVRDSSKLLVLSGNVISEDTFANIASLLPAGSLLVSNETRVVHARLLFTKPSGSTIEIFCIEPVAPIG